MKSAIRISTCIFILNFFIHVSHSQNAGTLVTAKKGMVVSASREASQAGLDILKKGGNAVDAAVATGFALAVTYPTAGNIGGGLYMVIRLANGKVTTIDARETAPADADRDMYLDERGRVIPNKSLIGPISAGVPGSVDGLLKAHQLFGKMKREALLQPAITLARDGYALHPRAANLMKNHIKEFEKFPSSMNVFTKSGKPYAENELFKQPDLAQTLSLISEKGRDGFYRGATAEKIVDEMKRGKGVISLEDLHRYAAITREPIIGEYRGYQIISMGPSSSGGVALVQLLNVLENYDMKSFGHNSVEAINRMVEVMKYVYADRAEYLGDPDFIDVPVNWLISKEYAALIRDKIVESKPTPSTEINHGAAPKTEGKHTTHFTVVDKWGNAVAVTTTINSPFGSQCVVDGAGFLLNNEMDDFSVKPGTPNQYGLIGSEANSIKGAKRMLSSMTPTIVAKNGKFIMTVGTPGGSTIITTVLQAIMNVIDYGMNIADAVKSSRVHHQWLPDEITYEKDGIAPDVLKRLRLMGYEMKEIGQSGRVEAIFYNQQKKQYEGCSDPRGYGAALGF